MDPGFAVFSKKLLKILEEFFYSYRAIDRPHQGSQYHQTYKRPKRGPGYFSRLLLFPI
jgi:hypothetical protein